MNVAKTTSTTSTSRSTISFRADHWLCAGGGSLRAPGRLQLLRGFREPPLKSSQLEPLFLFVDSGFWHVLHYWLSSWGAFTPVTQDSRSGEIPKSVRPMVSPHPALLLAVSLHEIRLVERPTMLHEYFRF